MATKLIRLEDGVLVEVEAAPGEPQQISGGSPATRVESNLERVVPVLRKVCLPLTNTWKELNKDMNVEKAEVEIGLSFEAGGDVFIANSKAGATLKVKLVLGPKKEDKEE
jgi:Trypsin-co-occurring domain 1